jgi:hypothetical protein
VSPPTGLVSFSYAHLSSLHEQQNAASRGTWHKISAKHLTAYLEEMTFRFNRRKNPDLFVDTLLHMITADPMPFERLTA